MLQFMYRFLACLCLVLSLSGPALALPDAKLFEKLKSAPSAEEAANVASDIEAGWRESGSATIDLLLARAGESEGFSDLETARGHYDRILLIDPNFAEAWYRRAGTFFFEENTVEALRDLNEALRIEPRHYGAWLALGGVFEGLEADKQALESYREALKIYPALPAALAGEARLSRKIDGLPL